jgi:AcrR family transcriptional regulator
LSFNNELEVCLVQIPKEEVRESILAAAREEFLACGYENASIRAIATKAKTSKSNPYHYFADKDALFCAVVEPTLQRVKAGFAFLMAANNEKSSEGYTMQAQGQIMLTIGKFMFEHREDFHLLFYQAAGSTLASFRNEVVESLAEVLGGWVVTIAPEAKLSTFFLRFVAGFYVNGMEQMLRSNMTMEEAAVHMKDFLPFIYGGWKSVLQTKE